jgi:DNA-binding IclR family transcriptional regulator
MKSGKRVLEVLEFFAQYRDGASAKTIERKLGWPQSSTSVLLRDLTRLNYLRYDRQTREYHPTIRVALLGSWIAHDRAAELTAISLMDRLASTTGESVILAAQQGLDAIYIRSVAGTKPDRSYLPTGSVRPLALTAAGQSLLSLKSDNEIGKIVRHINSQKRENEPNIGADKVLKSIWEGRKRGYFITFDQATPGAGAIAIPVSPALSQLPLAIGIAAPVDRLRNQLRSYVDFLRSEANAMAH